MVFCNIRRTDVAWFRSGVAPVGTLGRRCLYFSENQRSATGRAGFGRLRLVVLPFAAVHRRCVFTLSLPALFIIAPVGL